MININLKIFKINFLIFKKNLINFFKKRLLLFIFFSIFILFILINIICFDRGSLKWINNYTGQIITVYILFEFYSIFSSRYKTDLYINNIEVHYILSNFSTKDFLSYKIVMLILKFTSIHLAIWILYFYLVGIDFNKINLLKLITLILFVLLCKLSKALLYQKNKYRTLVTIFYIIFGLLILLGILVISTDMHLFIQVNIFKYIIINNITLILFIIFLLLINNVIIYNLLKYYSIQSLVKYGNVKMNLNYIYKKIQFGVDTLDDANNITTQVFESQSPKILDKFYKLKNGAIIFKNLISIFSKDITQKVYTYIDILLMSIAFLNINQKYFRSIILVFILMSITSKINSFFMDDVSKRTINKLLPLEVIDFIKGYLFIPLILNIIMTIYIVILINFQLNLNLIRNIMTILNVYIYLLTALIINQTTIIKKIILGNTIILEGLQFGVLFIISYCLIFKGMTQLIYTLFIIVPILILIISIYSKSIKNIFY